MELLPYADNFIPVIPTDRLLHTDQQPQCSDTECPCHDELKQELQQHYQEGLVSSGDATRILEGRQVWQ
jgi:hypothetical protein